MRDLVNLLAALIIYMLSFWFPNIKEQLVKEPFASTLRRTRWFSAQIFTSSKKNFSTVLGHTKFHKWNVIQNCFPQRWVKETSFCLLYSKFLDAYFWFILTNLLACSFVWLKYLIRFWFVAFDKVQIWCQYVNFIVVKEQNDEVFSDYLQGYIFSISKKRKQFNIYMSILTQS